MGSQDSCDNVGRLLSDRRRPTLAFYESALILVPFKDCAFWSARNDSSKQS